MSVPVLDFGSRSFVTDLHEALSRWGFVGIRGHDVPETLLAELQASAARVFALPDSVKRAHETPEDGRQRGFTPFRVEHAKDQAVGDLKEFWHVGRDTPGLPPNRFPPEEPGFEGAARALFAALDRVSERVLEGVALGLGLEPTYFAERVRDGNSVLRILHYPPLDAVEDGAIRAAAHEDINLVTLLPVATAPGLELLDRQGAWLPVDPPPGTIVCDTGDMMQLLTAGRLPATTHRVVNPVGGAARAARFSTPFFVHPRPEVRLDPLDGSPGGLTAGEFLARRLRENGVAT